MATAPPGFAGARRPQATHAYCFGFASACFWAFSCSFETSNGIQTIRYPRTGAFLAPYVVEQP